ncbi:GIN domain-containing protein [Desulforamulus aquiferis]|uniref:DUF2807 domain-containing protein n=1 Tax=Desulforamulus aquiferis TaxID=1397668 RepID=A0AAW7Z8Q9_9FIRM|nr:DUF2807 domain-containing protein [Desulforamulus aquiferis]MDO7786064.1 DUF2807 domain-containing protein [Desulforamulus aquiferis]
MKKLYENGEVAIFSDKELLNNNGRCLKFTDGSIVDLYDYSITNFGVGEIEILYLPMKPDQDNLIIQRRSLGLIDSISLSGGSVNIYIVWSENNENYIDITGTEKFLKGLRLSESRGHLEVQTPNNGSYIFIGEVWVNGKRQKPDPDPLYGEITIGTKQLNNLQLISKGKGNVYSELPINQLNSKINGSMTLNLREVGQANVSISGSGGVTINSVLGNSLFNISGSGSITIKKGIVDEVSLGVSGSGSINAMVSVKKAYLDLSGSGNIVLDHVKEVSQEKKSGSGIIKVLRRG